MTYPYTTGMTCSARYPVRAVPTLPGGVDPLDAMQQLLVARNYSPRTVKAYRRVCTDMLRFIGKSTEDVDDSDVHRFLVHLVKDRFVSASTLNQAVHALRFLFGRVMGRGLEIDLRIPRKTRRLPVVLSRREVAGVIDGVDDLRYRTMFTLAYSAGLRVGEVVRLRVDDIDSGRGLVHVRGGKGHKDRFTVLSLVARECVLWYREMYRPEAWLFPGTGRSGHITERPVQRAIKRAARRVGIVKNVSMHTLRHSFATHALEDGIPPPYIQRLLGHESWAATAVYTHITRCDIAGVQSPLDRFGAGGDIPIGRGRGPPVGAFIRGI